MKIKTKSFDGLLKKLYTEKQMQKAKARAKKRTEITLHNQLLNSDLFLEKSLRTIDFGNFIKEIREYKGMSLKIFSNLLKISPYSLRMLESNTKEPYLGIALHIARTLKYPIDPFIKVCFNTLLRNVGSNLIVELHPRKTKSKKINRTFQKKFTLYKY